MRVKKVILTIVFILVIIASICFVGVYGYTSNVPKLTLKNKTVDVPSGITCIASEMVDVKCRGDYELRISILDTNIPTAEVTADKSSIYAGDTSGYVHIEIIGVGKKSEGGHPVDAYIFVGINEAEQSEIRDNSNKACSMIDSYLHNEYADKLEGAELIGAMGYYNQDVFNEHDDSVASKYLLVYRTKNSGKLYLTVSGFTYSYLSDGIGEDLNVIEDTPDDGGSYLYDIEIRNIESAETRNNLNEFRHESKIGDGFNMYIEDVSEDRYESWEEDKDKLIDLHTLYYVFIMEI